MKSPHRDPVFEEVAWLESRDCSGCGSYVDYACKRRKWASIEKMKRCRLWEPASVTAKRKEGKVHLLKGGRNEL